jgi:hypothetical protein
MPLQIETQPFQFNNTVLGLSSAVFNSVSAISLSGVFYGDGSKLTGVITVSGTPNQINASKSGSTVTLSLPNSAVFPGDVSVIGNLTIAGSATYINTKNLVVGDNIIYFNDNNYGSNVLDMGIVSHFSQAPLGYNHTGLIRRAGQGVPGTWTLFSGLTTEPASATNIDWNDKNIRLDSLSANLIGNVTGNADTVTNGVYTNGSYSDPSWITSLADTKITGTKFATNTLLQSTSALLTPLTTTNSLTSQLVLNTAINSLTGNWNTAYASTTALNLSSSSWNNSSTIIRSNSGYWQSAYNNMSYYCGQGAFTIRPFQAGNGNNVEGNSSTIAGGYFNYICDTTNCYSFIGGGQSNTINCQVGYYGCGGNSIVGGYTNRIISSFGGNIIAGGCCNLIEIGRNEAITGGCCNIASGTGGGFTFVGGGACNTSVSNYGVVAGGLCNVASGSLASAILGGSCNSVNGGWSSIVGGDSNAIVQEGTGYSSVCRAVIGGGCLNKLCATSSGYYNSGTCSCVQSSASVNGSSILGGVSNLIQDCNLVVNTGTSSAYSTIIGGNTNCINNNSPYNLIGGGSNNRVYGCYNTIVNGTNNSLSGSNNFILGSNITATKDNTTYVNNISSQGLVYDQAGNSNNWNTAYQATNTIFHPFLLGGM